MHMGGGLLADDETVNLVAFPLTRRYIHVILKSALSRAVEQQLLARNPADAFKKRLPKVERKEMVTLNTEESERLLESIKGTRTYGPVMRYAAWRGARATLEKH